MPNVVHTPLIPAPGRAFGTYSIVKQRQLADWASVIARIFSAPGPPASLLSLSKTEGDGAPGGATIVRLMPRSLSRTRAPHGAPSRASSLQRRAALCGSRPFFPRRLRPLAKAQAGGIGPRMAKLLAGSSYWPRGGAPAPPECERLRFLPAAGAASDPTRVTPHESALWRTGHH